MEKKKFSLKSVFLLLFVMVCVILIISEVWKNVEREIAEKTRVSSVIEPTKPDSTDAGNKEFMESRKVKQ